MKTKSKALLGVAVGLLVILGASLYVSGASLQGRFIGGGSIALSSSSPSGARSVSSSDDFLILSVTASSIRPSVLQAGDILELSLASDSDFDQPAAEGLEVILRVSGMEFGHGYIVPVDSSTAKVAVVVVDKISVPTSSSADLTFTTSTTDLLDDDAGVDDPLAVTMRYGSTTVISNTVNY